jgi:hypothetical protein
MAQPTYRGKRRARAKSNPGRGSAPAQPDRYQKFLPSWMKDGNGAAPAAPRPARRRRPRPAQRHPGGYTPGKFAVDR